MPKRTRKKAHLEYMFVKYLENICDLWGCQLLVFIINNYPGTLSN